MSRSDTTDGARGARRPHSTQGKKMNYDVTKYRNTPNRHRADSNHLGWKLGDILHTGAVCRANGYDYCGFPEIELPFGARVRLVGIHQTDLNRSHRSGRSVLYDGHGDVYVDFECIDLKNLDGTPVTCGNRHAWTLLEANPDHMICPDGSGDLGIVRGGIWYSYAQKPGTEADHTKPWTDQRAKTLNLGDLS